MLSRRRDQCLLFGNQREKHDSSPFSKRRRGTEVSKLAKPGQGVLTASVHALSVHLFGTASGFV